MNPTTHAVRLGFQRGWTEFRHSVGSSDQLYNVFIAISYTLVLFFQRNSAVDGTTLSLAALSLPSMIGASVVFGGVVGPAGQLSLNREDGTLLRAKATPNGVLAYVVGKVLGKAAMTVAMLVILLVPATLLFDGLVPGRVSTWVTLAWVLLLGLLATLPIGAVLGAVFGGTQSLGFVTLLVMALVAVSGVFYPITALPGWVQWVGQAFPVYWLGLGLRSALLPDAVAAAEVGGSWRHLETVVALGAWAVVGFALAPVVLRRMARRESGSSVATRRERAARRPG